MVLLTIPPLMSVYLILQLSLLLNLPLLFDVMMYEVILLELNHLNGLWKTQSYLYL